MLKHLLRNATEDQTLKQRMFITCCSIYKVEVQSLYNHTRRSIQPLQKQPPLIHCSVILNKLVLTQPVKKLSNSMKPKHSSSCSQNHRLKQLNLDHNTTLRGFNTHFHITFPPTTRSPKKSLCLKSVPTKILSSILNVIMTAIPLLSII